MKNNASVKIKTNVLITDESDGGKILVNKNNAIHGRNMARILARALAHQNNSSIFRIGFGNGGTFYDAAGSLVFKTPNNGSTNNTWEDRLYNETYSEVVDSSSSLFGVDIGSYEGVIRLGGGSSSGGDPLGGGVVSEEAGIGSNVVLTVVLTEDEPLSQMQTASPVGSLSDDQKYFLFDEIGLFSAGLPASATGGYVSMNVGDKKSTDLTLLSPLETYTISLEVDGITYNTQITTPVNGTGPGGGLTFGDLCEGINGGSWVSGAVTLNDKILVAITDDSGGAYPSISGYNTYGYLSFISKSVGITSTVVLNCGTSTTNEFFAVLTNDVCSNVNAFSKSGQSAGTINDSTNYINERERLLTHLIFEPILKSSDRIIRIVYTLTLTVEDTSDSEISTTYTGV